MIRFRFENLTKLSINYRRCLRRRRRHRRRRHRRYCRRRRHRRYCRHRLRHQRRHRRRQFCHRRCCRRCHFRQRSFRASLNFDNKIEPRCRATAGYHPGPITLPITV